MTPGRLALLGGLLLAGPATAQALVGQPADLRQPVLLLPDQGAIVFGVRRELPGASKRAARLAFARYDLAARDLALPPAGTEKRKDGPNWFVNVRSLGQTQPVDLVVVPVTAGDWVLYGGQAETDRKLSYAFCFGAPVFRVEPGAVVYFGDVTPFVRDNFFSMRNQISEPNTQTMAMAWSSDIEAARATLAKLQPDLAARMQPAALRNGATFVCALAFQRHFRIPGMPDLDPAP